MRFTHPRPTRPVIAVGVLVGLFLLVWVAAAVIAPGNQGQSGSGTSGTTMDIPAPNFDGPELIGSGQTQVDVSSGPVTVVSFWASWCTECRSEAPELDALYHSFRRQGVRFVGVNYEDQVSAAVRFARANGIEYPTVRDPNGRVGDAYGIYGLPTTFIVSSDGRIRYQVTGVLDVPAFTAELRTLTREGNA